MYEFEIAFKKSFCLSSSLKMMTLSLPLPGLKTGMDLRGRVLKRVWSGVVENNLVVLKRVRIWRTERYTPTGNTTRGGQNAAQEYKKSTSG